VKVTQNLFFLKPNSKKTSNSSKKTFDGEETEEQLSRKRPLLVRVFFKAESFIRGKNVILRQFINIEGS